jgi:type IV secretory pathway TraG/TraD family ATPase VirD4
MHIQTVFLILTTLVILYPVFFWCLYEIVISKNESNALMAGVKTYWFEVMNKDYKIEVDLDGIKYYGTAEQLQADPYLKDLRIVALRKLSLVIFLSAALMIPAAVFLVRYIRNKADAFQQKHLRGPRLVAEREIKKQIKRDRLAVCVPLSDIVLMPIRDEITNTLVSGAPGTGKTLFLSRAFEAIRNRNCKIICHDFKGDYVERFYDPATDIIFNPLDQRSVQWRVINEIQNILDLQAVSHSLIPMSFGEGKFWNDGAREVFSGLLRFLYMEGKTRNEDIWKAVSSTDSEIKKMLLEADAKAGAKYVEDASSKQALGILATMMQYVSCFEYLPEDDGDDGFSLMSWLTNGKGGAIYITNYIDCQDVLRPILSLMIDLLARRLLSLPDNLENRVFFLLDEFPQLQSLSSIERLLTTARSKGGSVWIGIQDISQVRKRYGHEGAQTILNSCGTSVVFRSPDPDTGEYFSRRIGECEYEKYASNFSISPEDIGDRQQMTLHNMRERLVSPAEIQHMQNLEAYVSMVGRDVFKCRNRFKPYTSRCESFILRPGMDVEAWLPTNTKHYLLESGPVSTLEAASGSRLI